MASIMAMARIDLTSAAGKVERMIVHLRGQGVILDNDLARLYGVPTKALVQAVNRNRSRFPPDFMFQLTAAEFEVLRSQFVTQTTEAAAAAAIGPMRSRSKASPCFRACSEVDEQLPPTFRSCVPLYDARFKVVFNVIRKLMAPPIAKSKSIGFQPPSSSGSRITLKS
jgi:hypothetical protein